MILNKIHKLVAIILCMLIVSGLVIGCGNKSSSTNQEPTSRVSEKETISTKEITIQTADGQALTFDVNEVETSVDNNGNTVYKLDDGTSVTLSKEGTAIVETKNEDGTTTVTKSESVTVAPVIKEVESTSNDDNKPNAQATTVASNKNTQGSTEGRTEAPTQSPNVAPTEAPTQVQTEPVTEKPTNPPETQAPTVEEQVYPKTVITTETIEYGTITRTDITSIVGGKALVCNTSYQLNLDVDKYMAQMESNLKAAGKVTIKEYCISQGASESDIQGNTDGAGYVPLYINQTNYQYILNTVAGGVNNAYYLEYTGRDGKDYVIRVYRI